MDSSREAKHDQEEERREDAAAASLVDVNLMVVLLSQLCTKDDEDERIWRKREEIMLRMRFVNPEHVQTRGL